jgi:hypothetical protein
LHLDHPIIFNHNDRNKAYEFIINKFRAKLTTRSKRTSSTMLGDLSIFNLFFLLFLSTICLLFFLQDFYGKN